MSRGNHQDMQQNPSCIPVIVGVGEISDRPANEQEARNSVQLMLALSVAGADAGGGWLERCERILVVPQLSFSEIDVPMALAAATGLDLSAIRQAEVPGDTPVRLLNDAANAIGAGKLTACAIVGAEAMRKRMPRNYAPTLWLAPTLWHLSALRECPARG